MHSPTMQESNDSCGSLQNDSRRKIEELRMKKNQLLERLAAENRKMEEQKNELHRLHSAREDMEAKYRQKLIDKEKTVRENWADEKEILVKTISELKGELCDLETKRAVPTTTQPLKTFQEELEAALVVKSALKEETEEMKEKLSEMRTAIERNTADASAALETSREHSDSIDKSRELLKISSERLASLNEELQDLKDKKACLANEISALKSGSSAQEMKNQNSLFAEVEERRQLLVNEYARNKEKAKILKAEIEKLKAENNHLRCFFHEEVRSTEDHCKQYTHTFNRSIEELTQLVYILRKRPENPQVIEISESNISLTCIDKILEDSRAESRRLRNMLEEGSVRHQTDQLFMTQRQVRDIKDRLQKGEALIQELTTQLEKYKRNTVSQEAEENPSNSEK